MIKLELIQGNIEIKDIKNKKNILPQNQKKLETPANYHYIIRTIGESWVILNIDGKDIVLRPKSQLRLADKATGRVRSKSHEAKLWIGKQWASISSFFGDERDEQDGDVSNAVAGVRG